MMAGNLPVVPSHASLSASGRAAAPSTIRNGGSEHFFGSHNNVRLASFQQQTASLRQSMQSNHVSGFTAGGRGGEVAARGASSGTSSGSLGKPSAGTAQGGRETNNSGFNRGNSAAGESANRGGTRAFTPPISSNTRGMAAGNAERGNAESSPRSVGNEASRGGMNQGGGSASRDGFRPFTPPSQSEAARSAGESAAGKQGLTGIGPRRVRDRCRLAVHTPVEALRVRNWICGSPSLTGRLMAATRVADMRRPRDRATATRAVRAAFRATADRAAHLATEVRMAVPAAAAM